MSSTARRYAIWTYGRNIYSRARPLCTRWYPPQVQPHVCSRCSLPSWMLPIRHLRNLPKSSSSARSVSSPSMSDSTRPACATTGKASLSSSPPVSTRRSWRTSSYPRDLAMEVSPRLYSSSTTTRRGLAPLPRSISSRGLSTLRIGREMYAYTSPSHPSTARSSRHSSLPYSPAMRITMGYAMISASVSSSPQQIP